MAPKTIEGKSELAAQTKKELAPAFMQTADPRAGLEDMDRSDIILPRLAIAQALSPAMKKANSKYIPGLEEGQLYNTLTGQVYGRSVNVVPLLFSKMRMKFEDMTKGGGILCISVNGINGGQLHPSDCATCPHSQFVDGLAPECDHIYNYACIMPDYENDLVVVSMKSTAISVAKQWNALMRLANKPAFSKQYKVETVEESRNNNDYFNFKVTPGHWVNQNIYEFGEQLYASLKTSNMKIDFSEEEGDASFNEPQNTEM